MANLFNQYPPPQSVTSSTSSSSSTGVNYLTNGLFETDISGYAKYTDTAQSTPVTGAGTFTGSNLTIARNTTSPLFSTGDMLISKTAVGSLLGFGVSYDFTLDSGITSQIMSIELFSKLQSGTYTDGELGVFLYDKTNAAFIPLSMQNITATTSGSNRFYASFFPSTSTSYRLIFHNTIANTTTSWAVQVDRIIIAPQTTPNAAAVGGWTAYTPSWTSSGTQPAIGNGTIVGQYRRIGQNISCRIALTTGSSTTYGTGDYLFSLPSGLTIDTSFQAVGDDFETISSASLLQSATTRFLGTVKARTTTTVIVQTPTTTSTVAVAPVANNVPLGPTSPATWTGAGNQFNLEFSVPIAQWTTNINLATDFTEYAYNTDTTTTAGATATTGSVSGRDGANFIAIDSVTVASQTIKEVVFSRAIQDTDKILIELRDPTSGRWVIPSDIDWANRSANSAIYGIDVFPHPTDSFRARVRFGNAGRTAYNGAYGATNSQAWSGVTTWKWRVRKVSNGNMAETPPVVRAEYTVSPTAAIVPTSSLTLLTGASSTVVKVEDTNSMVSTSGTITVTIPISGVYLFDLSFQATVASSTSGSFYVTLYKAASYYRTIFVSPIGNTIGCEGGGSTTMRCLAGDSITFAQKAVNNTSGNFAAYRITSARIGS